MLLIEGVLERVQLLRSALRLLRPIYLPLTGPGGRVGDF